MCNSRSDAVAVLCGVVLLVASATGEPPSDPDGSVTRATRASIREFVESCESVGFSGAVLAAREGQVVAAVGVGHADLNGEIDITPHTLFEIASVTKSFTAAAVMRLVQDGKLNLDDSIAAHLPEVPDSCRAITVRHLLQHTSGIPGSNSRGGGDDLSIVLPMFLDGGPRHEPGTHWEYWNQGYAILSAIIAGASGESYTDYCRRTLIEPAGMMNSCFTGDPAPQRVAIAVGRSARGAPRSALEHPYGSYGFQYRGMGGLVTSVWDLWAWDRALRGFDLLDAASKEQMFTPGPQEYGLGWFIRSNSGGRVVQSHGGGVRGFVCEVRRYPEQDAALFVLCNRDDIPVKRIADGVEAVLFGDPSTMAMPPGVLPERLQSQVSGRFVDERGNALLVAADGKVTRATIKWEAYPDSRGYLGTNSEGHIVLFDWSSLIEVDALRDEDGEVSALSMLGSSFNRAEPRENAAQPSPVLVGDRLRAIDEALGAELVGRYDDGTMLNLTITMDGRAAKALITTKSRPDRPMHASVYQNEDGGVVLVYGGGPLDVAIERDESGAVVGLQTSGKQAFPRPFRRLAEGEEPAPAEEPPTRNAPAAKPPQWAESLLGTYRTEKGIELVVAISGRMVTSHIHWSPRGPITYAQLQHNEAAELEFVEFSRTRSTYPVEITRDEAGRATRITVMTGERHQQFDRVSESSPDPEESKK